MTSLNAPFLLFLPSTRQVLHACLLDAGDAAHHRLPELTWSALEADLLAMDLLVPLFDHGRLLYRIAWPELWTTYLPEQHSTARRTLADYFSGRWHGTSKPYTGHDGSKRQADRGVAAQVRQIFLAAVSPLSHTFPSTTHSPLASLLCHSSHFIFPAGSV